jgi:hypothetical protein
VPVGRFRSLRAYAHSVMGPIAKTEVADTLWHTHMWRVRKYRSAVESTLLGNSALRRRRGFPLFFSFCCAAELCLYFSVFSLLYPGIIRKWHELGIDLFTTLDLKCSGYYIYHPLSLKRWNNSVDIATCYGLDCPGSVPGSARFLCFPQRPDRLSGPPSLLSSGYVYRLIFPNV